MSTPGHDLKIDAASAEAAARMWLEACSAGADIAPLVAEATLAFGQLQRNGSDTRGVSAPILDDASARAFADIIVALEHRGVSLARAVHAWHAAHGAAGERDRIGEATTTLTLAVANRFRRSEREASRRTAAFASTLAHELQNPLSVAAGAAAMLRDNAVTLDETQRRRFAEVIVRSITRATTLVSDISLFAPAAGPAEPRRWKSLRAVIDDTFFEVSGRAKTMGVRLGVVEPLPDLEVDEGRTSLVLMNLVWNAVKYRDESKSERWARVGVAAAGAGAWHGFVADNGLGIPADQQRDVFDRFVRIHPELASGDGLGLATCRLVLEQIGGRIWLDSSVCTGTTFYFTLPVGPT